MTTVVAHAKPKHRKCTHWDYMIDCLEFDQLVARANGKCELCGLNVINPFIDHDPKVGQWAIRGLLCMTCNVGLGAGTPLRTIPDPAVYLANPWHARHAGAAAEEPPVGAGVAAFDHHWVRRLDGWTRAEGRAYRQSGWTWERVNRHYGPHNLRCNDVAQRLREALRVCDRKDALALALDLLRAGVGPSEVARLSPFTDSYIRKLAREADIPPVTTPRGVTAKK